MKPHALALVLGNFVLFGIAFARLWALRTGADPIAISGAIHVMSVPAFGMMCAGLPSALPSVARWQTLFGVLSIAFFVAAAVLLIFRLSF